MSIHTQLAWLISTRLPSKMVVILLVYMPKTMQITYTFVKMNVNYM